jgi:hypothetical protein
MLRYTSVVAIVLGCALWSPAQEAGTRAPKLVKPLQPLLAALDRAKVSGSLELSDRCDMTRLPPNFRFPHWHAATEDGSPLEVSRETLADNPTARITRDPDGTIRMVEPGVPTDLLNVKISHISFESDGIPLEYAAFSPNSALLHAILRAPEIATFMTTHNIVYPFGEGGSFVLGAQRPVTSPHLAGSMDNLTLAQALDRVLKTFPGIWIYEDCSASSGQGRTVFFRFFSLQEPLLIEE